MAEFYTSGRAIDPILVLMVLETVVLIRHCHRHSGDVSPLALLRDLASGGSLLLAVRFALTGALCTGSDVSLVPPGSRIWPTCGSGGNRPFMAQ